VRIDPDKLVVASASEELDIAPTEDKGPVTVVPVVLPSTATPPAPVKSIVPAPVVVELNSGAVTVTAVSSATTRLVAPPSLIMTSPFVPDALVPG
jgi:hypothetical protein